MSHQKADCEPWCFKSRMIRPSEPNPYESIWKFKPTRWYQKDLANTCAMGVNILIRDMVDNAK